jgi:hypothetical protein
MAVPPTRPEGDRVRWFWRRVPARPGPDGGEPQTALRARRADYVGLGVFAEAVPGIHWRGGG